MSSFLAFLQIIQILGKWTWSIISNFQLVSFIILIWSIIDRLGNNLFRVPGFWEIIAAFYLIFWFRKKANKESDSFINIENQNTIQIISSNKKLQKITTK